MVDTTNAYGICAVSFNVMLVVVVIEIIRDHKLPGLAGGLLSITLDFQIDGDRWFE